MAPLNGDSAALLASRTATPIAELGPDLSDQLSRVVRGEITITWPYNSVKNTFAFLLAEPDVRLRRAKGQIRVELQGASAKAASDCGLGAGDELLFSLDGVEWVNDASPGRIPGARVEWQMQFNEKLVLQVKFGESGEVKHLHVDPVAEEQPDSTITEAPRPATPEPDISVSKAQSAIRTIEDFLPNEYPSPAFVKRARLSYGALFEGGFDIFEEDGGVRGKGRKRTRFGRDSSAWRYTSQSPSPEPPSPVADAMDEDVHEETTPQAPPKPQMTDEGCQTIEVEMAEGGLELVEGEAQERKQSPAVAEARVPAVQEPVPLVEGKQATTSQIKQAPVNTVTEEEPTPISQEEHVSAQGEKPSAIPETTPTARQEQPVMEQVREKEAQEQTIREPSPPGSQPENVPSTLFGGPKPLGSSFSTFGTGAPAQVESALSLADQVRFGFSHIPQTTRSPSPLKSEPARQPDSAKHDAYPEEYAPNPSKYADMNTYINAAEEQDEKAVHGQGMPPVPPAVERFGQGQWEMSTQSPQCNPIEGGHFGADALDEGARVTPEQPSFHADEIPPEKVPEGFASYGHEEVSEEAQESPPHQEVVHEEQPFVENEETVSGDEVGVEDEEDEDAEYDEYAYGERVEEGDYDQRNYEIPSDDDEGLSEQDEEVELEAEERYGNDEVYNEDGESEEWDEEERDYESEEDEEYDEEDAARGYQPGTPAAPAPPGEPVVISLLSDSEDEEEEPAPAPSKPLPATQPASVETPREPSTSPEAEASPQPQRSPRILQSVEKDMVEESHLPDNIFGGTHVVDFATLAANGTSKASLKVHAADVNTTTEASSVASQVPISFEMSGAGDDSRGPASEAAPSEGSSEGLFVSQPRARALGKVDQQTEDGSSSKLKTTDGASTVGDGIMERHDQEQARHQEEAMSVDELGQNEDTSMLDVDGSSFASEVNMDEDLVENEEDYISADEEPVHTSAVRSTSEVEEVRMSEDDVDLLDASSPLIESAPSERMASRSLPPESPRGSVVISEVVMTEVMSEVVITGEDDESLPDAQPPAQQEEQLAAAEPQELPAEADIAQAEPPDMEVDHEEKPADRKVSPPLSPKQKLEVDVSTPQVIRHAAGPAESQPDIPIDDNVASAESASEAVPETREDSSLPSQSPTVVRSDEDILETEVVGPAPQTEQKQTHQTAGESEGFAKRLEETKPNEEPTSFPADELEDETMILEQLTQDQQRSFEADARARTRSASPDLSVQLARQAAAARRNKKVPEPIRTSPRVTRARSSSVRSNATPEHEEDNSIKLARAALASPSRRSAEADGQPTTTTSPPGIAGTHTTTAGLKSDLTKRLRTELPECIPLRSLRLHVEKFLNTIAVVTSNPTQPTRAKGGPREYFMSFHVTDPSTAPSQVVEVQLYRPHKDSLPVVKPGNVVFLQRFQVKALSKKGWGLRTGLESAWAVWDGDGDGDKEKVPQIRGPPVEDWEGCVAYVKGLKEWFGSLDETARGKIERADRKLAEAGGGEK
ncbi:hypothetical protein VTI74DRAFT_4016 [Chaetomium olivicolor]